MNATLQLTIAKLELKQLEMIDRLSEKHNDYVIRLVQSTKDNNFLSVNGDWELISQYKEEDFIGKSWDSILNNNDVASVKKHVDDIKKMKTFYPFNCNIKVKNNRLVNVDWKGKYFPEIDSVIYIGRVKRG